MSMKQPIRKQIKAVLKGMSPEVAAAKSIAIAHRVAHLELFRTAGTVLLYLPIPGEVDVLPIAQAAWRVGKKVLAPTACDHCRAMRAILCCPMNEEMFHIQHGLRQPSRLLGELPVDQIDLVVVPAIAFDSKCNRLGRGGGFYDRFIGRPDVRARTIGVAFSEQIIENLPLQEYDRPVDVVVTDTDTYKAG